MTWGELLQIEWRAPLWWLLAAMPLLFALFTRLRRWQWQRYAEAHLQPWAVRESAPLRQRIWPRVQQWAFWISLACALAGPRLALDSIDGTQQTKHDMDLMIVLDVSSSMAATDVAPNRLARAKLKLQDLAARLHGERIGLIVYAGEAGLLLPLTRDVQALQNALELAQPTLFEARGSHLATALELAQRTLADNKRSRAVLLLSDADSGSLSGGAGAAAINAAKTLGAARIPLYVWAFSSDAGAAIPLPDGGLAQENGVTVLSRPDLASYRSLAALSNGRVVQVSDSEGDLDALYARGLLALPASPSALDKTRLWRELFAYPLGLALALLLWQNLRWRKQVLIAAAVAASSTAQADDNAWHAAHQAYQQKQYLVAQQAYRQLSGFDARMGEGAAAYRRKDFAYAASQFTQALLQARAEKQRADALYNLGNSYYYAGNTVAAADAFEGVLRFRPHDAAAKQNLARARGALKLRNKNLPPQEGVVGRKGRGFSDAGGNQDQPMGMEPEKDEQRLLLDGDGSAGAAARRLNPTAQSNFSDRQAERRAALKKLDLLNDPRSAMFKQLLQQDAKRESPEGLSPW